jgi:1-phosphofructokinase family hexose kinase
MIYTVTLDPMLDRVVRIEDLIYDDANHITEDHRRPSGKGINVSRLIKELGGESISLGFAGGYTGLELTDLLAAEGVKPDFTRIKNETRASLTIFQRKKRMQTLLCTAEPNLDKSEIEAFSRKMDTIPQDSAVVITGNVPSGMENSFFADLITSLKKRNIKVFLDSDGEAFKLGVAAGPFMIKPNIFELNRLAGSQATEAKEIRKVAAPYLDVVEYIVVSLGPRGAIGISKEGNYHAKPPRVNARNASSGAGDALLGGFVSVFTQSGSFEESLKMGVACGTATRLGISGTIGRKNDIDTINKEVIIEKF